LLSIAPGVIVRFETDDPDGVLTNMSRLVPLSDS
jgi:hypothetical protein